MVTVVVKITLLFEQYNMIVCVECFTLFGSFKTESSLWGAFLSEVNGEQARQIDRRYWHLSSDGTALSEGEYICTHMLPCEQNMNLLHLLVYIQFGKS